LAGAGAFAGAFAGAGAQVAAVVVVAIRGESGVKREKFVRANVQMGGEWNCDGF
jgi:hypothetical protein